MEEEKKKKALYERWWFWIIVVFIIIIGIIIRITYGTETLETNLNQEITEGKITYYISNKWKIKENSKEGNIYKYYYPNQNTMIMLMISKMDIYIDDENINDALDGYVKGLNLDTDDLISQDIKEINENKYGYVRFFKYSNDKKYEVISYFTFNGNEAYVFMFGEKYKINDKFINLANNMIYKTSIVKETEEEKQARLEKERLEKEQQEAEEKAKKEQEEKTFKESCQTYTFEQIARNPDNFKGTNVKVTGEVVQALYGDTSVDLRVNITKKGTYSTYYDDTIYVVYYPESGEDKILEDDIITIYGTSQGDYSYTSTMGAKITLPLISAKYITINQ